MQARLSATEDDDQLDKLIAQRKALKARVEGAGEPGAGFLDDQPRAAGELHGAWCSDPGADASDDEKN
jgi:hypothetical protein